MNSSDIQCFSPFIKELSIFPFYLECTELQKPRVAVQRGRALKQRGFPGDEQSKLEGLGIKAPNLVSWGYVRPGNSLEQLFCIGRFSPRRSEILYCLYCVCFGLFGTSACVSLHKLRLWVKRVPVWLGRGDVTCPRMAAGLWCTSILMSVLHNGNENQQ